MPSSADRRLFHQWRELSELVHRLRHSEPTASNHALRQMVDADPGGPLAPALLLWLEYSDATRWKAWLTSAQPRFAGCAAGKRVTGSRVDNISMSGVASPLRTPVVARACRWSVWARKSSRSLMAASAGTEFVVCRLVLCRLGWSPPKAARNRRDLPTRLRQARRRSTGAAGPAARGSLAVEDAALVALGPAANLVIARSGWWRA
jgi:hypothetical protein